MKKFFVVLSALVISMTGAEAGELAKVFNKLADQANIHNGDAYVGKFNPKKFNYGKEIKSIKDGLAEAPEEGDECRYTVSVGRREAISAAEQSGYYDGVGYKLKKLYKKHKLKAGISVDWDGESGDSEYCQINTIYIWGKDGDLLVLEYNFTT